MTRFYTLLSILFLSSCVLTANDTDTWDQDFSTLAQYRNSIPRFNSELLQVYDTLSEQELPAILIEASGHLWLYVWQNGTLRLTKTPNALATLTDTQLKQLLDTTSFVLRKRNLTPTSLPDTPKLIPANCFLTALRIYHDLPNENVTLCAFTYAFDSVTIGHAMLLVPTKKGHMVYDARFRKGQHLPATLDTTQPYALVHALVTLRATEKHPYIPNHAQVIGYTLFDLSPTKVQSITYHPFSQPIAILAPKHAASHVRKLGIRLLN